MPQKAKNVSILGSTGSIGSNALRIIDDNPGDFCVKGLAAGENMKLFSKQVVKYRPEYVSVKLESDADILRKQVRIKTGSDYEPVIHTGEKGAGIVATMSNVDLVLSAIVGSAALKPTYSAIKKGKIIALANKEAIVMAGRIMLTEAKRSGSVILPVDSEHSAIFQSMRGHNRNDIKRLILTASGGPFREKKKSELKRVKLKDALNHPNWNMGAKITIDSATLMNKALEIIEARWLFDIEPEKISVMIHPQSIIHSIVEYQDGSMISQMGVPDMRVPISYALGYPERLSVKKSFLNLEKLEKLTFYKPDFKKFSTLSYAYRALSSGESMCIALNAANESTVDGFLCGKIKFHEITKLIGKIIKEHKVLKIKTVDEAIELHNSVTEKTKRYIEGLRSL